MVNAQTLANIVDILIGVFVVFALLLTAFGFFAYSRTKIKKLLYISLGFSMFLVKGIILSLAFFTPIPIIGGFDIPTEFMLAFVIMLVLDVLILVILYFATFKKER
jgi:hypothetical protein